MGQAHPRQLYEEMGTILYSFCAHAHSRNWVNA